jgi:hypothetical protein
MHERGESNANQNMFNQQKKPGLNGKNTKPGEKDNEDEDDPYAFNKNQDEEKFLSMVNMHDVGFGQINEIIDEEQEDYDDEGAGGGSGMTTKELKQAIEGYYNKQTKLYNDKMKKENEAWDLKF